MANFLATGVYALFNSSLSQAFFLVKELPKKEWLLAEKTFNDNIVATGSRTVVSGPKAAFDVFKSNSCNDIAWMKWTEMYFTMRFTWHR